MKKRFLVATDERYYPSVCFNSIKFKININEEFTVSRDDEFVEIYDKETDICYSFDELFQQNKIAYVGEVPICYKDDPTGEKYRLKEIKKSYIIKSI